MSLTAGSGPFGERPRGRFDAEMPSRVLFIEDVWPRIRGVASGETVVDSPSAKLVHETGRLPVYHFPVGEVRMDLLVPTDSRSETARGALAWHDLRVGGRVVPRAAWTYDPPAEGAPWLVGLVAFNWDALDSWFAEAEELFGHPRDPYSRIDVCRTTRHVRVLLGDVVLADSRRARAVRGGAATAVVPAVGRRARRAARAERVADAVRLQGRRVVLERPAALRFGRPGPRVVLPGPPARRGAGARHGVLLLRAGGCGARRGGRGAAGHAVVGHAVVARVDGAA